MTLKDELKVSQILIRSVLNFIMLIILVYTLFIFNFQSSKAKIITVNDFPNTEKLNHEGLRRNWVHHNVKLETIPLNSSTYSTIFGNAGRVTAIHWFCKAV